MIHATPLLFRRAPCRQRGFGLLQVLLLIAVLTGLASMGYLQWRERSAVNSSRQERQALAQADRAVATFATVMRRLPCPDIDRDGLEDCGNGAQAGWLPSLSLRLAGADAGVDVGQLRYLVQRGGGANDLTVLDDAWRPLEYDTSGKTFVSMRSTTAMPGGSYQANILTLTDFCQRLDDGRRATYAPGMAEVRSTPVRTVAYALAHPGVGDADGNGSVFDGVNASSGNAMEDPARRPFLAQYNDIVLERSFPSLLEALHCSPLIDSINTVALANDVVEQVDDLRSGNIDSAKQAIIFAALGAALTGVDTAMTMAGGISDAGNAGVDWAICAASLGFAVNACAAGAIHTSAAVAAGAMMYLNFASVAANITTAAMAANVLVLADSSQDPTKLTCPVTGIDMTETLAKAKQAVTDAQAALADLDQKIAAKQQELNGAIVVRDNAIGALRTAVRAGHALSGIDGRVDTLMAAATSWGDAWYAEQAAIILIDGVEVDADGDGQTETYKGYQEAVTQAQQQVALYADMVANRTAKVTQLNADIAALDAQIKATTDVAAKEALQKSRLEKTSQLTLLNDPVALQKQYDDAVSTLNTAQAALTSAENARTQAQANRATAQASYQSAYNSLRNAGRYSLNSITGTVENIGCTGGCAVGDVLTGASIQNALADLFGGNSSAPDPNGKYLKPIRLQKELDGLKAQRASAVKRVDDLQKNYDTLKALPKDPMPPCNVSGTGVTPMPPSMALDILILVDEKGGTR